jgi:dihydrofolate reductase
VRGNVAAEVIRRKQQPGKDMLIFGSARIAQKFVRLDLVDEYDLVVGPVILGRGLPLFKDVPTQRKLKLVYSNAFTAGAVALRYIST